MNLSDTHSGEETRYDSVSVFHVAGYVVLLVTLGAVLSVAAAGAATEASTDGPVADGIVVDLDGEGNAVVTVTVSFDLTVEGEQSDFEAFAGNEAEQQAQLDQYESRLSNVAAEVESQTGREMTVTNASISTQTRDDGDRGLVVLQAAWKGLAANDGGRLVLGAPFDGGFNADRAVAVRPPEQHRVVSTAPEPTDQGEQLLWSDDQSLDEFEVVVEPLDGTADDSDDGGESTNPDGSDGTTDDEQTEAAGGDGSGPGFGIVVALLGIAGLRLLARRR
jgi:PGF-CTERM protein